MAQRRGWIAANPLRGGAPFRPKPDSTAPEADPYDQREIAAILAAAEEIAPRWVLMVRCWLQSGLRSGEIRGLRERDLDPQLATVRVERTRSRGRTGRTKTPQSRRLVRLTHPVCEAAACETDASVAVLVELTRVVPHDLEAPLFPSLRDRQRPMDEGDVPILRDVDRPGGSGRCAVDAASRNPTATRTSARGCNASITKQE